MRLISLKTYVDLREVQPMESADASVNEVRTRTKSKSSPGEPANYAVVAILCMVLENVLHGVN